MGDCKPTKNRPVKPPSDDMKKVLVLYVSGCIGRCIDLNQSTDTLVPVKNKLYQYCRTDPTMNDVNFLTPSTKDTPSFCVLPADSDSKMDRVAYLIYEYDKLTNSSNVTQAHWKLIAKDIQSNFEDFDGFVILHGRDTMAYSASALSFMFENLSKPLVITGALKPIFDIRSDAKNNLKTSILVAGNYLIPEVTIFFRDRLLRGNRSIQRGADSFFAFDSLNVPPLLQVGCTIKESEALMRTHKKCKLVIHSKLNPNVAFIRVYPGLPVQVIKACLEPPVEGVVMHTYGTGTFPIERTDLTAILIQAIERGVIVTNCTQCPTGGVTSVPGTGKFLENLGVIFLGDMTIEAAITKLMYVLSKKKLGLDEKKKLMMKPIRGEMTDTHTI